MYKRPIYNQNSHSPFIWLTLDEGRVQRADSRLMKCAIGQTRNKRVIENAIIIAARIKVFILRERLSANRPLSFYRHLSGDAKIEGRCHNTWDECIRKITFPRKFSQICLLSFVNDERKTTNVFLLYERYSNNPSNPFETY